MVNNNGAINVHPLYSNTNFNIVNVKNIITSVWL